MTSLHQELSEGLQWNASESRTQQPSEAGRASETFSEANLESPLQRAERLVTDGESRLRGLVKLALARGSELAEDVWAEAQATKHDTRHQ